MAVKFEKYPAYKDSGVEWLGEIPEHWDKTSLGSLLQLKSDKNHPDYEVLSVYREYGVIQKDSRDDNHNATSLDTSTYKAVEIGDLVVNKMKAWQGSMGISSYKGIVSPAYITCKVNSQKIVSPYLHQLLRSNTYIGEYNRISYGIRVGQWDMRYEDFKRITVAIPPLKEQTAIASFIDQKTAKIDQAIAQKVKLIELLKERRQILIHHAVTKGLDDDDRVNCDEDSLNCDEENLNYDFDDDRNTLIAKPNQSPSQNQKKSKFRPSGVEWIGEIPEHWEVKRLKYFSYVQSGVTLGKTYFGQNLPTYQYLRVANVQSGHFKLDDMAEIKIPKKDANKYLVRKGDILVTEGGDLDKLGRGTVWMGEIENCLHQNHVFAIRVNTSIISPQYASMVMESDYGRKYFTNTANKTTNLASTNSTNWAIFQ